MPAFDEQDYTKSFQWGTWKRLMPVMRPYRRDFVSMFAFNLITAAIDVVLPLFQRYAISNYIEAGTLSGLLPYTLCYFGVILLQALSVVAFARNSMKIEMCAGRDMRANLFTHLQTLSFSFYNVTPVGYLLSRVMSDTSRIASMVAWNLTDILWAMFYVLGTFAAMLLLNWKLALVVIVIVPVIAVLTGYFQNRILHWNRRVRKLNSRITGAFNEGITGAKTSKTLGIEEQNTASFRALERRVYPPRAVLLHGGRGHRAAARRLYGAGAGAADRHALGLHDLRRRHFRADPDDGREHRRIHLAAGLH